MKIRRLPCSILDADEIWDRVAAEDIEAADRLVERIAKAAETGGDGCPVSG